jgi:hypothetical protein
MAVGPAEAVYWALRAAGTALLTCGVRVRWGGAVSSERMVSGGG